MRILRPNVKKLTENNDIEGLIQALSYPNDIKVVNEAIVALGISRSSEALMPLIALLEQKNYQPYAAWTLGEIGDSRAIIPLIESMSDVNRVEQVEEALVKIGEPAVDPLLEKLNDILERKGKYKNKSRKRKPLFLIEILGNLRDRKVVGSLIKALHDDGLYASRELILKALGNIGDPNAIPTLEAFLGSLISTDYKMIQIVNDSIAKITTTDTYIIHEKERRQELEELERKRLEEEMIWNTEMAKKYEIAHRFEDSALLYEKCEMWKDAGRVRKFAQRPKSVQHQYFAEKIDLSTNAEIRDSVVNKSQIGGGNSTKQFSICPYCSEELNLPKTPRFCPYCREQLQG